MQLVNPKMLERFVRLEGIPPAAFDQQLANLMKLVSEYASQDQIQRLTQLKDRHMSERESIWAERSQIIKDIRVRYFDIVVL